MGNKAITLILVAILAQCLPAAGDEPGIRLEGDDAPDSVGSWVGAFHSGDSLNTHGTIELLSNGKFEASSGSCWGPWGMASGTWSETASQVVFETTFTDGEFSEDLTVARKIVREDGIYLIPEGRVISFKIHGPNGMNCFRRGVSFLWWKWRQPIEDSDS